MEQKDKKSEDDASTADEAEESAAADMVEAAADSLEDEVAEDDQPAAPSLEAALAESKDKLLRALAEAENTRRRAKRDKSEASKYAIAAFAREMLGVADNLHRALASVDETARAEDEALDTLMVGVEMTEREMLGSFERIGITPIDALDKKFDHNFHQAMFEVDDENRPAGTVVQILQTGYMLHDRLLRPAQVGVSKGGPKETPDESDEEAAEDADASATNKSQAYDPNDDGSDPTIDEEL